MRWDMGCNNHHNTFKNCSRIIMFKIVQHAPVLACDRKEEASLLTPQTHRHKKLRGLPQP